MKTVIQVSFVAVAALVALGLSSGNASAVVLTCQSAAPAPFERTWTLGDASACNTGPGNPNSSGDITGLGGEWDDQPVNGTFRITTGALSGNWSFSQIAGVQGGSGARTSLRRSAR